MDKKFYKGIITTAIIFAVALICLTYYVVGIYDTHSINQIIDKRLNRVEIAMLESQQEIDTFVEQIGVDSVSKAKSLSFMINQNVSLINDIESLEEVRISLGADDVLITDEEGTVVSSTGAFVGQNIANDPELSQFMEGIGNPVYGVYSHKVKSGLNYIYGASSSRLTNGVVIVKLSSKYLNKLIDIAGVSSVTSDFPFMKRGGISVIDINSWNYLSSTYPDLTNTPLQINKNKFAHLSEEKPSNFKITLEGKKNYVRYIQHEDKIILANVRVSEMFARRNFAVGTLCFTLPILTIIILLSVRQKLINDSK